MQGATELLLLALAFVGLQIWWVSTVVLNRPRRPRPLGKPMKANSLQKERTNLQKIFDRS